MGFPWNGTVALRIRDSQTGVLELTVLKPVSSAFSSYWAPGLRTRGIICTIPLPTVILLPGTEWTFVVSLTPNLTFIDPSPGAVIRPPDPLHIDISGNRDSSSNAHTCGSPTLTPVFRDTSCPREINLCCDHRPSQIHAIHLPPLPTSFQAPLPSKRLQLFSAVEGDSGRRWDGAQTSDPRVISPSILRGTSWLGTDNRVKSWRPDSQASDQPDPSLSPSVYIRAHAQFTPSSPFPFTTRPSRASQMLPSLYDQNHWWRQGHALNTAKLEDEHLALIRLSGAGAGADVGVSRRDAPRAEVCYGVGGIRAEAEVDYRGLAYAMLLLVSSRE
ncbi:hypothetical protein R3P38DRAFT_3617134 [Favolaschia claudopus]|uniref:Uncharacterized protein n=1 Tax=Favolaschia claudopus TaxID=2862362 RepID=A0AAW0A340_9AGAR